MGPSDPTLTFLDRLRDESQWVIRRGVPIFEPHERDARDKDGKPITIRVTERDLPRIARESNRLEAENGVVGVLTDRHTIRPRADGAGFEPVPDVKVYGVQRNYRVGTYGVRDPKTGRVTVKPAVLADWYFLPDVSAEAARRPHRSVEYQHGTGQIRGTAVMVNAPFLDMGMVALSSDQPIYCYQMGASVDQPNKPTGDQPQFTDEEKSLFEKCRTYMRATYGLGEEWPGAKKEESANPEKKTGESDDKKAPITPMQKNGGVEVYAALQARVAGLEQERDIERCQLLVAEGLVGYSLNADEKKKAISSLAKLPAADRSERVEELKAIYAARKVPAGMIEIYGGKVEGGDDATPGPMSAPWYHEPAMAYMREEPGTMYEKAVAHILATHKK
ncbi:hypothetical protein GobsT_30950 [Gemmata obscuriglobus]|uniref:DUF2213 domain-containing protein n=1 Tax=Gemmata obscuriglobus TaxID=114 RepID=A0A2Z3HAR2_9BACT|nr:hypothetical protein [Gemmata obscuriglobus]AWM38714.1 hypothetical protein C1280_18105 [Gemmata obscuriglobus]QEG28318.1 hypothetical protein GobsT_30950 [Gemmata obscuriglobus]VTS06173.1 unnamed protein product [Gemmata obscuriglobus UQM 2246]